MTKARTIKRLQTLIRQVASLPEDADILTAEVAEYYGHTSIHLNSGIYAVGKQCRQPIQIRSGTGDEYTHMVVQADGCEYVQLRRVEPGTAEIKSAAPGDGNSGSDSERKRDL